MTPTPALYDFRRPSRLGREHMRALQMVNDVFARQSSLELSTTLHASCHVTVAAVRQLSCDEYVRGLVGQSLLAVLSFDPLPGAGVLQLPMGIVMGVVDRLLGGPGGPNQPSRPLTEIETDLVRRMLQRIVGGLTYAFESLAQVHPEVGSLESDSQFLKLAAPSDPVVVSEFHIRLGDVLAECSLCLPFATLQPAFDAISDHPGALGADLDPAAASRAIERCLYAVPVDVTVAFREVTLGSPEVLALAVGDVLPLRHPVSSPLRVSADGVSIASAVPGSNGQRLACQIVSI